MIYVLVLTVYSTPIHLFARSKAIAKFESAHACDVVAEKLHRSWLVRTECFAVLDSDEPFTHDSPEQELFGEH